MEVMLHRRLLYDDFRGVAEPLNETACGCRDCACHGLVARGKHLVSLHVRPDLSRADYNARAYAWNHVPCA